MSDSTAAGVRDAIAARMRAEHVSLSARWLERLRALVPVPPNEIFPTERLLDHIPSLIEEIAGYLQTPSEQAMSANTAVIAKAQELGELRHWQQASVHQLLAEYRLLGGILSTFVQEEFERLDSSPAATVAIELDRRLHEALWILTQTTVDSFVSEYVTTIADHASRLDDFNRMVSHEFRQPLGTVMYALPLLKTAVRQPDPAKQDHLFDVMERNVRSLIEMMQRLEIVTRVRIKSADTPDVQTVELGTVAGEVARQLREMAEVRGVEIRIVDDLPSLVIDVARLELILINIVSNALKYSDPRKTDRFVMIEQLDSPNPGFCTIAVRDNGIGIPKDKLASVFQRFVRVHPERDDELGAHGSGLGLAIVADCILAVRGTVSIESTVDEGTSVLLTLPKSPEGFERS